MFRSCRNHFRCFSQMKITNPELFQNALKIILLGTGNVLSPHKYFQFERTLKNDVVNSESAFWDIFEKGIFLLRKGYSKGIFLLRKGYSKGIHPINRRPYGCHFLILALTYKCHA